MAEVPPALEEWADLNRKYDQAEEREDQAEMDRLDPEIKEAWESAPLGARIGLVFYEIRQAWRDRIVR